MLALGIDLIDLLLELLHLLLGLLRLVGLQFGGGGSGRAAVAGGEGEQGLSNGSYWLAFWTKVLQPLVTAALVLMAISFIFGPLRSVTLGQRVFTGVLVGFVFRIAQDLLGPSSLVFGFSPLLAVVVPAGICALAGFFLLRRAA